MRINFFFDHPTGCTAAIAEGRLDLRVVMGTVRQAWEDPRFDPNRPMVADLRHASLADAGSQQIADVVREQRSDRPPASARARFAIIALTDVTVGIARIYEAIAEGMELPLDVSVFRSRLKAWDWATADGVSVASSTLPSLAALLGARTIAPADSVVGLQILVAGGAADKHQVLTQVLAAAGAIVSSSETHTHAVELCADSSFDAILVDDHPPLDGAKMFSQLAADHRARVIRIRDGGLATRERGTPEFERLPSVHEPLDGAALAAAIVNVAQSGVGDSHGKAPGRPD